MLLLWGFVLPSKPSPFGLSLHKPPHEEQDSRPPAKPRTIVLIFLSGSCSCLASGWGFLQFLLGRACCWSATNLSSLSCLINVSICSLRRKHSFVSCSQLWWNWQYLVHDLFFASIFRFPILAHVCSLIRINTCLIGVLSGV